MLYNLSKPELYTCVDRINKLYPDCSYWQILSLVCPWNTMWHFLYPVNPKACAKKAGIVSKVYWRHEEWKKFVFFTCAFWWKWNNHQERTEFEPMTSQTPGRPLSTELWRTHGEQAHILGSYLTRVLHTARIGNVEIVVYDERMKCDEVMNFSLFSCCFFCRQWGCQTVCNLHGQEELSIISYKKITFSSQWIL